MEEETNKRREESWELSSSIDNILPLQDLHQIAIYMELGKDNQTKSKSQGVLVFPEYNHTDKHLSQADYHNKVDWSIT